MPSLINAALLKEQLKRFWAIAALSVLGYLLLIVLPMHAEDNNLFKVQAIIEILSMRHEILFITTVLLPLVAALSVFSYLFQPKAALAFHAFPLNRDQLFFTNLLTGAILLLLPLLALCAALLAPVYWNVNTPHAVIYVSATLWPDGIVYGQVLNTLPLVAGFFARVAVAYMFYYALFSLVAMLSGHAVVAVLLCAALPLAPAGAVALKELASLFFLLGYSTDAITKSISDTIEHTNALGWTTAFHGVYPPGTGAVAAAIPLYPQYLTYGLTTLAALAGAFWLNRARRQERAGDSVVFTGLKRTLIFLLSVFGMLMTGAFLKDLLGSLRAMYAGFALGFIVTYFIAQMIAEKTFAVGKKIRQLPYYGGLMAGLFFAAWGLARLDVTGYENRLPRAEDVASVRLSPIDFYRSAWASFNDEQITDPAVIAATLDNHAQLLTRKDDMRRMFKEYITDGRHAVYEDDFIYMQDIAYHLRDGGIVTRRYHMRYAFMKENTNWEALVLSEPVALARYPALRAPEYIEVLRLIVSEDGVSRDISVTDRAQILSLAEALKKDTLSAGSQYLESRKGMFTAQAAAASVDTDVTFRRWISAEAVMKSASPFDYDTYYIHLEEYDDHTQAWLDQNE